MKILTIICLTVCLFSISHADTLSINRVDSHAPIGVMGDHSHNKNEWMISYRFMNMNMNDALEGTNSQSTEDIWNQGYMTAPIDMTMHMHMIGSMYGLSNKVTLMGMIGYKQNSMDHKKKMMSTISEFTKETQGISDLKLASLIRIKQSTEQSLLANIGTSIPLGSIDEKDGETTRLPYPMQIGSGTVDFNIGLTYTKFLTHFSWGAQSISILRTGKNKNGYRLGNQYQLVSWIAKPISKSVSISAKAAALFKDDITGSDSQVDTMITKIPTASTENGKTMYTISYGINYQFQNKLMSGLRLALEINHPIHQNMNGIQLKDKLNATFGWQHAF